VCLDRWCRQCLKITMKQKDLLKSNHKASQQEEDNAGMGVEHMTSMWIPRKVHLVPS